MKAHIQSLFLGICLLWHCLPVFAQSVGSLCPNTALVPVFKQDFGQSVLSTTTSTAAAGSTNYIFGSVGTDGNYIVTPMVNNANKADWTKGGDHTGNTNGNMFLVNAGGNKSIFFQQTITGLCPGSSFNFSAWLANMNTLNTQTVCGASLVYPKVIFNIKNLAGTVLGTVTTDNLPLSPINGPPNWQQYGFQFSLPTGVTSLILEMVDFYGGAAACGNDVALDDILFTACTPQAYITLNSAASLCSGSNTSITSTLINSPFTTPAYQWQKSIDNGASWQNIGIASTTENMYALNNVAVADGGMYKVLVGPDIFSLSTLSCISESNSILLTVNQTPTFTITNNSPLCTNLPIHFQSTIIGGTAPYIYNWTGPNGFSSSAANPIILNATIANSGVYFLALADANGCSANSYISASVNPTPSMSIVNNTNIICSNSISQIQFNSSLSGALFFWNAKVTSGLASGYTSSLISSSSNTIHDTLQNSSNTKAVVRYVINAVMSSGCTFVDSTAISIYPNPSIANAGIDQTLCNANTISLNANSPLSGNGNWSFLSGPSAVTFSNSSSPTTTVNGLIVGNYQFIWTISNNVCADAKDTVGISVSAPISIANAGIDQIVCNANTITLNANSPLSGNGNWSFLSGPSLVTFSNSSSPTTTVNGLIVGNYQFIWTISNNVCADAKDTVAITISAPISIANAGIDQIVCNANTISLHANSPLSGNGNWSFLSGPSLVTFSNSSSPTTSVNGLIVGNYQFIWTISNNVCADAKDTVGISVSAPISIANAGIDQTLCNANTISLHANSPLSGNGNWSVLSGPSLVTFSNSSSPTTSVNGLIVGNYQFIWTISNNVCADAKDTVGITISAPISIANAGIDQIVCNANTISLHANSPNSGNGNWSFLSGPSLVTFSNSSSPTTSVNGLIVGNYQFIWTISNNVCADAKDTVGITVLAPIINTIDSLEKTICIGELVLISGNVVNGSNIQYQWEQSIDGIIWKLINGANSNNYSFVPSISLYIRRQISSSSCLSKSSTQHIILTKSISANNIIGNQEICIGQELKKISGSLPMGGNDTFNYRWEQSIDSGASWSTLLTSDSIDLILKSITRTTFFRRIVTTQVCSGALSSISNVVSIIIKMVPTINLLYKGGIYCSTNTTIEFTPQTTNTDSILWDFGDGNIESYTAGKVIHQYANSGTFLPKLLLLNTNRCSVTYTAKDSIIVDDIKTGFKLSAIYDCGTTQYRFIDTSQSYFKITNRLWLINQSLANTEKTFRKTFYQTGDYLTKLTVTSITGCSNTIEAKFNVAIYSYPQVNINAIGQACLNNLLELKSEINSVDSVAKLFWNLGNGNNATDSIVKVFYYSEGKYTVKLTVATINNCYDSALKQLTIHPIPKIKLSQNITACRGDSLELKADGAVKYIWSDRSGKIICNNCSILKVAPQKTMLYNVIGYSQFGCSEIGQTSVTVIQPFTMNAKLSDTICIGETKRLYVSGASNYSWYPDSGLSNYNIASPYAKPSITTIYRVIGKDNFNCFTDSASIRIVVGKPTTINLGRDSTILAGTSIQFTASGTLSDIKKYRWLGADFSCLTCSSPTAKIFIDQCISCVATNIYGCNSTDTICIKTFCPNSEVFIPNAFSPDADGINDRLVIQGKGIKMIKNFRVFSRWGEMIFEKTNFLPGDELNSWDGKVRGKAATPDIFVYICEVLCEKGLPATFKGNVAILK